MKNSVKKIDITFAAPTKIDETSAEIPVFAA
jgi:hypothetical protein